MIELQTWTDNINNNEYCCLRYDGKAIGKVDKELGKKIMIWTNHGQELFDCIQDFLGGNNSHEEYEKARRNLSIIMDVIYYKLKTL